MRPDNTEAEFEAFTQACERLAGFDDTLSPEWVDGYLTAVATHWQLAPVEACVPAMFGDSFDRTFADPEDRAQALRALGDRLAAIRRLLDPEVLLEQPEWLHLSPLMLTWTDEDRAEVVRQGQVEAAQAGELVTGAVWSDGFLSGVQNNAPHWVIDTPDEASEALFAECLADVRALGFALQSEALREHVAKVYKGKEPPRDTLVDDACFAVQTLRVWSTDHMPRPATRRVEKSPGRNDVCPCGSGKKFKKCHGAAEAA